MADSGQEENDGTRKQAKGEAQMSEKAKRKAKAKARDGAAGGGRPPPPPTTRLLFIGNSLSYFNSGIWFHLHKLCRAAKIKVECTKVVKGGASLQVMWTGEDDQLGEDGISKARAAIRKGGHDIVFLQEDLPETTVESFHEFTKRFVEDARAATRHPEAEAAPPHGDGPIAGSETSSSITASPAVGNSAGGSSACPLSPAGAEHAVSAADSSVRSVPETVLLMTWEYPRLGWITQEQIADAHAAIAAELSLRVAPAGLAWLRCIRERPGLELYMADREHPSTAGTYLTVCVVFALVFLDGRGAGASLARGGDAVASGGGEAEGAVGSQTAGEEEGEAKGGCGERTGAAASAGRELGEAALLARGALAYFPSGVGEEDGAFLQSLAARCVLGEAQCSALAGEP